MIGLIDDQRSEALVIWGRVDGFAGLYGLGRTELILKMQRSIDMNCDRHGVGDMGKSNKDAYHHADRDWYAKEKRGCRGERSQAIGNQQGNPQPQARKDAIPGVVNSLVYQGSPSNPFYHVAKGHHVRLLIRFIGNKIR